MSRAIRLTRQAVSDLADIISFTTATWGTQQAARYTAMIASSLRLLASNPGISRAYRGATGNARKHNCGSHVILLKITATEITIYRLLHKSMVDNAADWDED